MYDIVNRAGSAVITRCMPRARASVCVRVCGSLPGGLRMELAPEVAAAPPESAIEAVDDELAALCLHVSTAEPLPAVVLL